jgi:hypothetical protein
LAQSQVLLDFASAELSLVDRGELLSEVLCWRYHLLWAEKVETGGTAVARVSWRNQVNGGWSFSLVYAVASDSCHISMPYPKKPNLRELFPHICIPWALFHHDAEAQFQLERLAMKDDREGGLRVQLSTPLS